MTDTKAAPQLTEEDKFPFEKDVTYEETPQRVATTKVVEAKEKPSVLPTMNEGRLALASIAEQTKFAEVLLRNQMVSPSFKNTSQIVIGFQYLKEINMPIVSGMKLLYVINSRPCLYSEGPLMLVQRSGLLESIDEFFFDEEGKRISFENQNWGKRAAGAVTRVKRKGDPIWQEDIFTHEEMKQAGLDVGKSGKKDVWVKWEKLMLRYKARSIALKSKFADCIGGLPIAEMDEHFSPEIPEVNDRGGLARELNEKFSEKEAK